ncbi:MAG TPA: cupin domain-containing protein [Gemmatimonadales bacterium]|jgi:quercetin dioxygenase-like cupin family protein|nr:cupin domain-containing protein [Gemmatimonadales bacterium]
MTDWRRSVLDAARFNPDRAAKADLFQGTHLLVGLNCFEPGQSQAVHAHAGADKFYLLLSGKARMQVGDQVFEAASGELIWAPAGVPHGVEEAIERTVMLVAIAPAPPSGRAG